MQDSRKEILARAVAMLADAGVDSPELSAQVLLAHVLKCSRVDLFLERDALVVPAHGEMFRNLLLRRALGEPVAYLTGIREFYGLEFRVRSGVLIPRPETELLIDRVRELYDEESGLRFADLGTGSGIIAVTLARLFPQSRAAALDISEAAIEVARENILLHGVEDRVLPVRGDFAFPPIGGGLDLIVSNPPYLSCKELEEVSMEVRDFEPGRALVSGPSGVECLETLAVQGLEQLRSGGRILVEMGYLQGDAAGKIFSGWDSVRIHRDLAGKDRLLEAVCP